MVQYTLPAGATAARTAEVNRQIVDWFLINEKANTDVIFTVDGFSFSGSGQNTGMAFVSLKNWSQRKGQKTPPVLSPYGQPKSWAQFVMPRYLR